jgi:hypothetical protein
MSIGNVERNLPFCLLPNGINSVLRCAMGEHVNRHGILSRRDLLRLGGVGIGAALLPPGSAAPTGTPSGSAKSVIFLWMAGGVTHIDSFDPKPDAPEEIRGTLTPIQTDLPGVRFAEVMPGLARQLKHMALVRSFSHDSNDHFISQARALSGRMVRVMPEIFTEPNIGAIVSKVRGSRAGFPGYMAVPGTTRPGPPPTNLFVGGWLGRQYAPFPTGGTPRNEDFTARVAEAAEEDFNQQALQPPPGVDTARVTVRQSLRARVEQRLQQWEAHSAADALDQQYQGAFTMLTAPAVRQALDLRREAGVVRDRYGRTKIGQRCLLARRLVEAGAPFVMVDYGYDPEYGNLWDNHRAPVQNQPHICDMAKLPYHLAGTDRACAALIQDLHDRGLLEQTLVVFMTEFGRTPRINREGGRDHWGAAGSILFAGGGTRGGQVIGATDRHAALPTTTPFGPASVAATIYRAVGISTETLLYDRQRRPLPVLPHGEPIPGVLA